MRPINPQLGEFYLLKNNNTGKVVARTRAHFVLSVNGNENKYSYSDGLCLNNVRSIGGVEIPLNYIVKKISPNDNPELFL